MADSHREEIAKLEALYAANPGGRVFVHLAEAYRKAGEHERARRILDEGLARHTDSASGYVVLGRVLADMQIADEAAAAFRRVLELDSGNLVALRWLGDLARQSGRNHEAVAHYRELLARNPSNEEVRDLVEIVEREAVAAPRGQDALDDALEPEWNEPVEEPAPQVDDSGDALTPLSAAPGQTGDIEPADMELTIVELALEEPGEEERAVQHAPADDLRYADDLSATHDPHDVAPLEQSLEIMGSFESAQPDAVDSELVESRHAIDDDDVAELGALTRSDEADALDIHLLDPAWSGDEPEGGEFADDDFLADLTMGAGEEHEPDELTVDRVDLMGTGTPLTLQSEPAAGAEEPAALADETGASQDEPAALAEDPGTWVEAGTWDEPAARVESGAWDEPAAMDESGAWEEPAALEEEPGALAAESGPRSDVDESPVEPASPWHADARNALDDLAAEFGGEEIEDLLEDEQEQTQEPVEVDAGAATGQDLGLVTETMAELYRSQGFHERAAEVYRALLRQRPYDLRLSAKLSETEADVAAAAAEKAAAAAAAAPEDEAAGEVWLRGVGSSWDAGEPAESAPESPYAWTPEPEDQSGGTSIGSYLRDLVSWKTATQRWAATPQPPAPPPASPSPSWSSAGDPWGSEGQTDEPWGMTEDAAALDPWGSPAPSGENVLGSPPEAASAGAPGQAVEASGSGDPWTSSPTEPVSPVETGRESEPADPWLLGITDTPADPWGGATEAASGTPWQQESVQDPAKGEPEAAPAPAADAGSQGEQGEQDREDEDLEMFRSWLQSLKK